MLKTILFGGTSISSNKPPVSKTQGKVWQVTSVTPGAIAFVAVLVCPYIYLWDYCVTKGRLGNLFAFTRPGVRLHWCKNSDWIRQTVCDVQKVPHGQCASRAYQKFIQVVEWACLFIRNTRNTSKAWWWWIWQRDGWGRSRPQFRWGV